MTTRSTKEFTTTRATAIGGRGSRALRAARARRLVAVLALGIAVSLPGWFGAAQAAPSEPRSPAPAQFGSLHRVAAALHSALDVHRLALQELVPAARLVLEAGSQADAVPTSPVPAPAREVFERLARSLSARLASEALPAVARAYNAEVQDALEQLASSGTLGEVAAPLASMVGGLGGVLRAGDEIVDLFSRQRPIQVHIVDPATILDEVNEALDEVARAERRIADQRKATPAQQLQAFMRLELALGHALDLIAAAEESGIQVGFELPLATGDFASLVALVRGRTDSLASVVADLQRAPLGGITGARAMVFETIPGQVAQVNLTWTSAASTAAVVRVRRVRDAARAARVLASQAQCAGSSYEEAMARSVELAREPHSDEHLADVAPQEGGVVDPIAAVLAAWPAYELTPVTAFGVRGETTRLAPVHFPTKLAPPALVRGEHHDHSPFSEAFYRDATSVTVSWELSSSDGRGDPGLAAWADTHGLPLVRAYRVERLVGEALSVVVEAPAGRASIVDRPSAEELRAGVRYVVTALGRDGAEASSGAPCAGSPVRVDVGPALRLASSGAGAVERPTRFERDLVASYASPQALAAAKQVLAGLDAASLDAEVQAFWSAAAEAERRDWLARWPELFSESERAAWLLALDEELGADDAVLGELWLRDQPGEVRAEVDRYWALLDAGARRAALRAWTASLGDGARRWLEQQLASEGTQAAALRPLRARTWWSARDLEERTATLAWWRGLGVGERHERLGAYFAAASSELVTDLRWLPFAQRAQEARAELLRRPPALIPDTLVARWLAWRAFERLDFDTRVGLVAGEAGTLGHGWARLRYAIRPLDARLGFQLPALVGFIALVGVLVAIAKRVRR